jgi:ABC-type phosphate transport system ATPase subunit
MHTLGADSAAGLLLFDEPSAALDPVAEHGIFPSSAFPFIR